jgi:hypothetical protein
MTRLLLVALLALGCSRSAPSAVEETTPTATETGHPTAAQCEQALDHYGELLNAEGGDLPSDDDRMDSQASCENEVTMQAWQCMMDAKSVADTAECK